MNSIVKAGILSFSLMSMASAYEIPDSVQAKMNQVIDSYVISKPDLKAGISVSVRTEKGQWSYCRGAKRMDNQEDLISTKTPFMIFSITKNIVCAYALDLVRRGDLRLDAPIGNYYDFQSENIHISNSITIAQLMNHRSGLNEFSPYMPQGAWNAHDYIALVDSSLFEPGTSFTYSSSNTVVLALIIEMVTGKDLNTLLKERFFDRHNIDCALTPQDPVPAAPAHLHAPLSLVDSTLPDDVAILSDMIPFENYGAAIWTGGSIMSTPGDIAKWGYDLFSGNDNGFRWIGDKMKNSIDTANTWPFFGWVGGYGCASVPQIDEENIGFHGYGWGTSTSMYYLPSSRSCISVFINQRDVNHSFHQHFAHFPLTNVLNGILMEYLDSKNGNVRKSKKGYNEMYNSMSPVLK